MSLKSLLSALLVACPMLLAGTSAGTTYTQQVLYDFCGAPNCSNGGQPEGALLRDASGNIFGTAEFGVGPDGGGGVFELTPSGGSWKEQVIFALCTASGCPYGAAPVSGVIMDTSGNLYGTTSFQGIMDGGTVFELIPNKNKTKWKAKLLFAFCSDGTCADGATPNALTYAGQASGVPYDGVSPLYGTTSEGGTDNGGVAYELIPPQSGKKQWKEKVLHVFCSPNTTDHCTNDGGAPQAGMIMDASGNLYGTTQGAGLHAAGAIFELSPKGKNWKEKVLYNFCSQPSCADGGGPSAPLLMDAQGNLLGTAGNVFKFDPKNSKYAVLYTFCSTGTCSDGTGSPWSMTIDDQGNLYGASYTGGNGDRGVVWALDPAFQDLYTFCPIAGCKDGANPSSPLLRDASGNLIGTTYSFGAHGAGVLYELTP